MKEKLLIIGAGGHANSVVNILIENNEYDIVGCLDSKYRSDNIAYCLNIPVIGSDNQLEEFYSFELKKIFVAIGSNEVRGRVYQRASDIGFEPVNAISKYSVISSFAKLGKGISIMAGAVVNANTIIEDNCVINTNCSVDHDCQIGRNVHIAPGAAISGGVVIGDGSWIGTGSSIIEGISIGTNTFLGAGSVVVTNIPNQALAFGVPAKVIGRIE